MTESKAKVREPEEINTEKLKKAMKEFNSSVFKTKVKDKESGKEEERALPKTNLKLVGLTVVEMRDSFLDAIEGLQKEAQEQLSDTLVNAYNFLVSAADDWGDGEPDKKGEAKKPEPKKAEKKAEPKKAEKKATPKKPEPKKVEKKAEPKKAKPAKKAEGKDGRMEVFTKLMKEGGTRQQLGEKMLKLYGGSEAEAKFQVWNWTKLLITMGFAKMDEFGVIKLVKG